MIDNIIEAINNVKQFEEEQGFNEKIHQSQQRIVELKKISEEERKLVITNNNKSLLKRKIYKDGLNFKKVCLSVYLSIKRRNLLL